jgi:hypothetical protein
VSTSHPRYRLVVAGRLSETAVELIGSRFGPAASVAVQGSDSRVDLAGDQPALRALLTLLWDLGHDLLVVGDPPDPAGPSPDPLPTATDLTRECTP